MYFTRGGICTKRHAECQVGEFAHLKAVNNFNINNNKPEFGMFGSCHNRRQLPSSMYGQRIRLDGIRRWERFIRKRGEECLQKYSKSLDVWDHP